MASQSCKTPREILVAPPQDPFKPPHISWSHYNFPSEKQKFFIFIGGFVFCSRQLFLLLGFSVAPTTLSISCSGFLGLLTELSQTYRLLQTETKCLNFVIVFSHRQVPAPTLIIIARSFQSPSCLKFLPSCKATGVKCRYKTDILQKKPDFAAARPVWWHQLPTAVW